MRKIKTYNEYQSINEAWYHNLLATIALLGGVSKTTLAQQVEKPLNKVEQSMKKDTDRPFFAACLSFTNELAQDKDLLERGPLLQARQYFQDRRDGKHVKCPDGKEVEAIIKSVMTTVHNMDDKKAKELSERGDKFVGWHDIVGR